MSYRNAETAVLWTAIAAWGTVVVASVLLTRIAF